MNIPVNTPELILLRSLVEKKAGIRPTLSSHFMLLAAELSAHGERLSQSTVERVWLYSTRSASNVARHTLDVLSRYVDATDWDDFRSRIAAAEATESASFGSCGIDSGTLAPGARLRLSWLPNRTIVIRHLGQSSFIVEQSVNSSLAPDDSFDCLNIQAGQPLYLDRFRRSGSTSDSTPGRYVIGRNTGLTSAEIIDE